MTREGRVKMYLILRSVDLTVPLLFDILELSIADRTGVCKR